MSIQNKHTQQNQNKNQNKNQNPATPVNKAEPGKPTESNVTGQPKKEVDPKAPASKPAHS